MYDTSLGLALRAPWLVLLAAVPLLAAGYFAYSRVPSGVLPTIDEGGFVIDYVGPPGASLDEMARLLSHVEAAIKDQPEVLTYSLRTGYGLGGDIAESHTGDFFVRLKPLPRRPIAEVMDAVRARAEAEVPGLEIEPLQLMEDLIGDLTGRAQPVVVNLFGSDEQQLVDLAPKLADQLSKIDGLSSVENGVTPAGDAFSFTVDRVKAALEGVDADAVTRQASALLGGDIATKIQRGEKTIDVRVWTPAAIRHNTDDIAKLQLRAPDGHLFPLGRVATFTVLPGEPELTRQDLQRVVAITARSSRDLGSTIRDVQTLLDQKDTLPAGVRYTLGGQFAQQQAAFQSTARVVIAAAALVFLLLLFLYESLRVAIAILFTTGLAIVAVLIGLWLTGTELNISSMMGMVMIVGNVTEVAIFYFSEYAALPGGTDRRRRLIDAGEHRLRAITMTTLAAILALLPLALDLGHSAGLLRPLAIAIIAGLAVQLPLVLIVLPMFLMLLRVDPQRSAGSSSSTGVSS